MSSLLPRWGQRETVAPPEGLMAKLLERYKVPFRSDYGQLKLSCPLPGHEDRTPSCSVNMDLGLFNCKACGEQGGIYEFIEAMEGVGREKARRIAADLAGGAMLSVPEGGGSGSSLLPGWAGGTADSGGLLPAWARARCPA